MPTLDHAHHDLEFRLAVIGPANADFLEALPLVDQEMQLGELRGWKPRFVFRDFGADPFADGASSEAFTSYLPYVDAIVLTDAYSRGLHYSSTAVERLCRTLGPKRSHITTAIFGGPALAEEWATLTGITPVASLEPLRDQALELVKLLAANLLKAKMRSTPPPPAS
jgi:hypothetical protein